MKRVMVAIVFVAGLVGGLFIARYSETTVLAQRPWTCKSFEMDSKQDTANSIGGFLGSASTVELTSAGLEVASRYIVVACRN